MVFDDNEMETGFVNPQDPLGIYTGDTGLDQPAADFADFNGDEFLNNLNQDGNMDDLFGSPSAEKSAFDFAFEEITTGNEQAAKNDEANKAAALTSGAGSLRASPSDVFESLNLDLVGQSQNSTSGTAKACPPPVDASFSLALPQDTAQASEAGSKTGPAAAPCALTLPPTPAPAPAPSQVAANSTNGQLTMPDSAAPFSLTFPEDPMPSNENSNATSGQTTIPTQGLPDFNAEYPSLHQFPLSDFAIPYTEPTVTNNYLPRQLNAPMMAASAAMNSYTPQQPYIAQQQQAMQPPSMPRNSLTGAQQVYMPQPQRVLPPLLVGTPRGYTPVQRQPYMAQPQQVMQRQSMVGMPQQTYVDPYLVQPTYPSFQHAPPAVMQPVFPNSYAPQPHLPQLTTGHLQPAANLYAPYGAAAPIQLKRPAPYDDEDSSLPPAKKIRHRRDGNRRPSNDPARWYQPQPSKPTDWSPPPNPTLPPPRAYRTPLFKYNDQGEWLGNVRYSRAELEAFLVGPGGDGKAPSRQDKLTLWIQSTPAYELHRYGPDCSVCRWDECPVKKNTIAKGQFRVALDERGRTSGTTTDPFRVAGYMHLFCFEECFELATLMSAKDKLDVAPDTRTFLWEERNPMALTAALVDVVNAWIRSQSEALKECMKRGEMERVTPPRQRLWRALTRSHTSTPGYLEQLDKRNDIHVGKYMGDLRLYQQMKDEKLMEQREARVIEIDDDEDERVPDTPAAIPVAKVHAVHAASKPEVGAGRVARTPVRRPSLQRYTPPASRKRSREAEEDYGRQAANQAPPSRKRSRPSDDEDPEQAARSRPRRPSLIRYTPPASRKRSRSDDEDEGAACDLPSPAKRSRFGLREVQADTKTAVRDTLAKQDPQACAISAGC
jgi:hypothetical protein